MGGPTSNEFYGIQSTNVDVALVIGGLSLDMGAYIAWAAAVTNTFDNYVFECELAISLSDYTDENGAGGVHPAGAEYKTTMEDGSVQKVVGNTFDSCEFIAEYTNLAASLNGSPTFFRSARTAFFNAITNSVVYDFEKYQTGSINAANAMYTPVIDGNGKVAGFDFSSCILWNPNSVPLGDGVFPSGAILGTNNDESTDPYL